MTFPIDYNCKINGWSFVDNYDSFSGKDSLDARDGVHHTLRAAATLADSLDRTIRKCWEHFRKRVCKDLENKGICEGALTQLFNFGSAQRRISNKVNVISKKELEEEKRETLIHKSK